jgi:hypothetical protein
MMITPERKRANPTKKVMTASWAFSGLESIFPSGVK